MGKLFNRQNHQFSEDEPNDDEVEDIDETDEDEIENDIDDTDDEEDDGEEDDDDGDEEEISPGEELSDADIRRAYRHKRRIRNQIIAYGVVAIFVAILVIAGVMAQRRISAFIKVRQEKKESMQLSDQENEQEPFLEDAVIESPSVIEETEEDTMDKQLEDFITTCIQAMPLEDKVAGLFIVTPETLTGVQTVVQAGEGTQEALSQYAVGGLIYFSQNIVNEEQVTEMLSNTVSMSKYPIFLAVDEEGGSVTRVAGSNIGVETVDDMAVIGAEGDTTKAYEAGVTIGSYLSNLGFNLDFAPVADIADADNVALENRSFGKDAEVTAEMVSNVVKGLEDNNVSACLKHFPGIGSSEEDTHNGRVEITKTLDEMRTSDFIPFQAGIDAGVNMIMVSHVSATGIDEEGVPSSLSRSVITDVLRGELGYDGIVITDALNMSAVSDYYTSEEAVIKAIRAGVDMLLMPEDFDNAFRGLLTAVQDGTILEERIDESLRRIYRIKYADKLE